MRRIMFAFGLALLGLLPLCGYTQAFESGGFGAGCGGGIGANYGGSSFGCSGSSSGLGYTYGGWTNGGGVTGFGGIATVGRGYAGWSPTASRRDPVSRFARVEIVPAPKIAQPSTANTVLLTVNVPADARLFINDQPTKATGTQRYFSSDSLLPDTVYPYHVRVEFVRDGKAVSEEQIVPLCSGLKVAVDLGLAASPTTTQIATSETP